MASTDVSAEVSASRLLPRLPWALFACAFMFLSWPLDLGSLVFGDGVVNFTTAVDLMSGGSFVGATGLAGVLGSEEAINLRATLRDGAETISASTRVAKERML